jgi:hypothetical protein
MEECDFWWLAKSEWLNHGCNPDTCKISWVLTFPDDWKLIFGPTWDYIIWENMDLFRTYSLERPYLKNQSSYDFYFKELCVVKKSGNTLNWNTVCEPMGRIITAWLTYAMSSVPSFVWNTSSLTNTTYWDNSLVVTVRDESWVRYDNAYFVSKIWVRVAKPTVGTTWGWTSYVSNANDISNVSEVAKGIVDEDKNKNFVWAGVSTWSLSSYTKEVSDASSVKEVWKEWDKYNNASSGWDTSSPLTTWTSENIWDFENYNWLSNAFILKDKKFVINKDTLNWLTWWRTYIIENANLVINADISYPDNIAFVVRWWNIEIDKSVKNIKGIFIAIPKWSVWGYILWLNGKTTDVLNVDGSLYGNIESLVDKRTYMKQNSSWLLDVWTVVSFGSSVFRDPAPLTTTFISEYLEAIKVAK